MTLDPQLAAAHGFPKPEYTAVERERRWLCRAVPRHLVVGSEHITDLYVSGTRLRLREARPASGGPALLRLSRKADVDARTRLITSIYLPEEEFFVLSRSLTGTTIQKVRHRLAPHPGIDTLVDEFQGALAGLFVAEVEFQTQEAMSAFAAPTFAVREISGDARFTGGALAQHGLPAGFQELL